MTTRKTKINPIAVKLRKLEESGKTSYEAICAVCDIRYPTFMNIFTRAKISKASLNALRLHKIINKEEYDNYKMWLLKNGLAGDGRGRRPQHVSEKLKSLGDQLKQESVGHEKQDSEDGQPRDSILPDYTND